MRVGEPTEATEPANGDSAIDDKAVKLLRAYCVEAEGLTRHERGLLARYTINYLIGAMAGSTGMSTPEITERFHTKGWNR